MRNRLILFVAAMSVLAGAGPALAAADPADAAADVEFRGYFAESGAPVGVNDMEALVDEFPGFGFVALAEDPAEGADRFADDVLAASSARTVIVVSPGELGYVSHDFDDARLDAAADAAIDLFDRSYVEGFRRFAGQLPGEAASSSGGGRGLLIFLVIIVAVIGFFIWRSRQAGRRRATDHAAKLEELKTEIRKELGTAANEILDLEERVRISENDRARELYAEGAQGYAEFQAELEAADSFDEIHELGNKVDKVLWQLEAAEALIEGRAVPPEPVPEPLPTSQAPGRSQSRPSDLPPDLAIRRDRRPPIQAQEGSGGGFGSLGGLGTIAVILREMQRTTQRGRGPSRTRLGSGRSSGGGVQVPRFPGFGSGSSRRRSSSRTSGSRRSPSRSSGSRSRPKGRGRRRR